MKTIQDVTNSINIFEDTNSNLAFYLVERNGSKDNYTYTIHSPSINQEIIGSMLETLHTNLDLIISKNKSTINLDPMFNEDSTLEVIKEDEVDYFIKIKNRLLFDEDINIINSFDDVDLFNVWYYCIKIFNDDNSILLFKKYSHPKSFINKGSITRMALGQLNIVRDEIFILDDRVDVMHFDDTLVIFNKYFFELIFSFNSTYMRILDEALGVIKANNAISNYDKFKEACINNNNTAKKFTKIMKDNSLDIFMENLDRIPTVIDEYDLEIEFTNNKLIYKDKSSIPAILKLLSDDFVKTALGKIKYEAPIKRPL